MKNFNEMKQMEYGATWKEELLLAGKYNGFNYIIMSYGKHPCCYIEIPRKNKLYKKHYGEINSLGIEVHGDFTYSDFENFGFGFRKKYYIGWDYAHHGVDFSGLYLPCTVGKKWTTEELLEEIKLVIDQIAKI